MIIKKMRLRSVRKKKVGKINLNEWRILYF